MADTPLAMRPEEFALGALLAASAIATALAFLRPGARAIFAGLAAATALAAAAGGARTAAPGAAQALSAISVFALAFAADSAIRRYFWFGLLADGGRSRVPNIAIGMVSAAGYALTGAAVASLLFGLDLTAFAAASGVLAIVLGVSAQQTIGQFFAGMALNVARPFRLGDSLQIDGVWGVVADMDWRAVTLRTYEGTRVSFPNLLVAGVRTTNLGTSHDAIRHHIAFAAEIDVPPSRVRAAALEALRGLPHVLDTPAPMVLFKNYDERGAAYEAIFWHRDPNVYILRRDEAGHALWYALERAGIRLSANRRLHAAPADLAGPAPGLDAAARALAMLAQAPLFAGVPRAELAALAERGRYVRFADGERIMRETDPGETMFLILDGRARVLSAKDGRESELYALGPGEVVGHMSALTGAPRFATVRADGHLEMVEFGKDALAPLMRAHPEAAEMAAKEIVRIADKVRALDAQGRAAPDAAEPAPVLGRLVERIRVFFGDGHRSVT
ncbi:MAG: mechanosensitive ion channel family protein [Tagaea sp.]|nr:mechanosensitive ion channel family protein [Tagaea sp.]